MTTTIWMANGKKRVVAMKKTQGHMKSSQIEENLGTRRIKMTKKKTIMKTNLKLEDEDDDGILDGGGFAEL